MKDDTITWPLHQGSFNCAWNLLKELMKLLMLTGQPKGEVQKKCVVIDRQLINPRENSGLYPHSAVIF